jgi:hypothetical protein
MASMDIFPSSWSQYGAYLASVGASRSSELDYHAMVVVVCSLAQDSVADASKQHLPIHSLSQGSSTTPGRSEKAVPTSSPLLIGVLPGPLKWFDPKSPNIRQFMLDKLEECTRWEKIEGETRWTSARLESMIGPLSSRMVSMLSALQTLGKGVVPLGRVSFMVLFSA